MYRTLRVILPLALGALVWIAFPVLAQTDHHESHEGHAHGEQDHGEEMDPAAMMEAYKQAAAPGEMHHIMSGMAGEWSVVTRMWMQKGAPPMETTGTATMSSMFDGRFLQEVSTGEMMGQQYESFALYGYNNGSKKFETMWVYTMGTGMLTMEGTVQEDGSVVWEGKSTNDMGMVEEIRALSRHVDPDLYVMEMMAPDGMGNEKGVLMESTYTRVTAGR